MDVGEVAEVSGLGIERQVLLDSKNASRARTQDSLVRKRPGRVKYGDITLKKGYIASSVLNDWIEAARLGDRSRNL